MLQHAETPATRMRDLPAQRAQTTDAPAAQRARYFNSGNAFNIVNPPVPYRQFRAERDRALDPATGTALIAMDLSDVLGCGFPATTPLTLARYARIRAGERLAAAFRASGEICYAIAGAGVSRKGADEIAWAAGDVFCLPGGAAQTTHRADADGDAVLWIVTNEPLLAFERLEPPAPGQAPVEAVHYPAAEIRHQLELIHRCARDEEDAGLALIFSSDRLQAQRNIMPSLTLAMNSLPPGAAQRAHRHNSIALNLPVQGDRCWSAVEGRRIDWSPWAMSITPPGAVHSHHNGGDEMMQVLIVQDGGLHYHCRTMGFSFAE